MSADDPSSALLERRRPVWEALSDAFLDTEVRWYFPRIAGVLAASGYSPRELERIWRYEIVPECSYNLYDIAGEWAAMPIDEEALLARAKRPEGFFARLRSGSLLKGLPFLGNQWRSILELRRVLAGAAESEREPLVAAWTAFAHVYVEESLDDVLFLESEASRLQGCGLSKEAAEETFERDFRPIYRRLLIGKARLFEKRRAANVRAVIGDAFGGLDQGRQR